MSEANKQPRARVGYSQPIGPIAPTAQNFNPGFFPQAQQPMGQLMALPARRPRPNKWQVIAQILGGQQQQPFDFAGLLREQRNDPQGDRNKVYMPGVDNEANPFSNGFFGGAAGRMASAQKEYGPSGGFLGLSPGQQAGAMSIPQATQQPRDLGALSASQQMPYAQALQMTPVQNPYVDKARTPATSAFRY